MSACSCVGGKLESRGGAEARTEQSARAGSDMAKCMLMSRSAALSDRLNLQPTGFVGAPGASTYYMLTRHVNQRLTAWFPLVS